MRILYFADIRFPLERANGIQTMETCHALVLRGHVVDLVVRPDTHSPAREPFGYYGVPPTAALTVERAPVSGPALARRLGYLAFAAGRAIGGTRADLVMTRDLGVAAVLMRVPWRAPLVYESHGYAPDVSAALPGLVSTARPPSAAKLARLATREQYVWQHADGYVTITGHLATALAARFGGRPRVAVVHDGARLAADGAMEGNTGPATSASAASSAHAPVTVAYAGHLYAWKGVDILLDAMARVPDVRGLVVGGHDKEADLARLRALAARLGITERVTFTGHVLPSAVAAHLAQADILVLPNPASVISTHSTSPLKLFEYMAAGKAIVASDLPAIREVLEDEVTAILVAPGDPEALAAGIRRLVSNPDLRARIGGAARRAVAEYSWDRRAERLEALFTAVLASTR